MFVCLKRVLESAACDDEQGRFLLIALAAAEARVGDETVGRLSGHVLANI